MAEQTVNSEDLAATIAKIRRQVEKYSEHSGYPLNPEAEVVETVIEGLARNRLRYGRAYCPCVMVTGEPETDRAIICPCDAHKADIAKNGMCHCALYTTQPAGTPALSKGS